MLVLDGLTKSYDDVVALSECSFSVNRGEMLGFLGPNGAGKTTAMRSIFGIVSLDSGAVSWEDRSIDRVARLSFGYMPEERGLYPRMAVLEQVKYFGRLHGMAKGDAEASTRSLLEELGLTERVESRVQDLSHGNQQRVQLAVALVHNPDLLVLDEPFSGLDPVAAETMAAVLRRRASAGAAVLFSSHQLDVVEDLCEDVAIINEGSIVIAGQVDELRASSEHRHVEVLVQGNATWADDIPRVAVISRNGDRVELEVATDTDPADLLARARTAGDVVEFNYGPPSLSAVFREAVAR